MIRVGALLGGVDPAVWAWASVRCVAALVVLTSLTTPLPRLVALGLGGALALLVAACVPPAALVVPTSTVGAVALGLSELARGVALGLAAAAPVLALGWAARLVAVSSGEPATRSLWLMVGAAVFVGIDGPGLVAHALATSYVAAPMDALATAPAALLGLATAAWRLAVPALMVALIVELAVGAAGRVAGAAGADLVALPWRRGAVVAVLAGGLVLTATTLAAQLRAAWS